MNLDLWRLVVPLLLALSAAWLVDRSTTRRGLRPPGFDVDPENPSFVPVVRRVLAVTALAVAFAIGVFGPLGVIGLEQVPPEELATGQLFQLHQLFMLALFVWYVLGFAGGAAARGQGLATAWKTQFGLATPNGGRELALGAAIGVSAWLCVLIVLMLVGSLVYLLGGDEALPQSPPVMVTLVAGLPFLVRFAVSLSAGFVEELFFRGFLQPRVGIGLSTGAFVLAHVSYEQTLMLVGITLLSLIFAFLVRWRQSIWAAVAAHTVFDSVQLLFVIPQLLDFLDPGGVGAAPIL